MTENIPVRAAPGKWSDPRVPTRGWECINIEDLEEPAAICEMCETTEIRYVHVMHHPEYPDTLDCGCICAGHMQGDPVAAREREANIKRRGARRSTLARPKVACIRTSTPMASMSWFSGRARAGARFVDNRTGLKSFSPRSYVSEAAAKLAAFDAIARYKAR